MMNWRVPFGDLKIGPSAKRRITEALDSNWISEGRFVREFEKKFAEKFGWKHAITTSSGTDAGMVVWSAIKEIEGVSPLKYLTVVTPACAFASTANCLMAARCAPVFCDIELTTLNLSAAFRDQSSFSIHHGIAIQFVATMGKPTPIREIASIAKKHDLYLVADFCEAHGADYLMPKICFPKESPVIADHYADAAIYSFYVAHLIQGGEGGIICTDDDELASLCRSIKSHGRPAGATYFSFDRIGYNSKWNEMCAAVALEGLEKFDEAFAKRREVRRMLVDALSQFEDDLIIYRDGPGEVISPHAFPIVLRDETRDVKPLCDYLERSGVQVKTLFGSLPTQHKAFELLGHELGDFPVAERVGRTGLHFGCNEFMTEEDVGFITYKIGEWLTNI